MELGESVARTPTTRSVGYKVLVVSLRMWTHHAAYESVVAHALRLRGADVAFLTCGGGLPICEVGSGRRVMAPSLRPLRLVHGAVSPAAAGCPT